jgi:hypothetical protein
VNAGRPSAGKAEGKQLGRPRIAPELEARILNVVGAVKAGAGFRSLADSRADTIPHIAWPIDAHGAGRLRR